MIGIFQNDVKDDYGHECKEFFILKPFTIVSIQEKPQESRNKCKIYERKHPLIRDKCV